MTTYILRRVLINVPVLLGVTILVFTFLLLAPGDPVSAYIKPELGDNIGADKDQRIQRHRAERRIGDHLAVIVQPDPGSEPGREIAERHRDVERDRLLFCLLVMPSVICPSRMA